MKSLHMIRALAFATALLSASVCLQGCGDDNETSEFVDNGDDDTENENASQSNGGPNLVDESQSNGEPDSVDDETLTIPQMKPPFDAATPNAFERGRRLTALGSNALRGRRLTALGSNALEELEDIRDHFFSFPNCNTNICGETDFKGRLDQMDQRLLTMLNLHNTENRRACLSNTFVPVEWAPPELPGNQHFPMHFSCVTNNSSPDGSVKSTFLGMDEHHYYVADFAWPNFEDSTVSTSINVLAKINRTLYEGLSSDIHVWQIWLEGSNQTYSHANLLEIRAGIEPRECSCTNLTLGNETEQNCECDTNLTARVLDLAYASSQYGQMPGTNRGVSCGVQLRAGDGYIRAIGTFTNTPGCSGNGAIFSDVCGDGSSLTAVNRSMCNQLEPGTYNMTHTDASAFASFGAQMLSSVRELDLSKLVIDFDTY